MAATVDPNSVSLACGESRAKNKETAGAGADPKCKNEVKEKKTNGAGGGGETGGGEIGGGMEMGAGGGWSAGQTEGVAVESKAEADERVRQLLDNMLNSYRIHSMSSVNALLKVHPALTHLAEAMVSKWTHIRQDALQIAVASLKDPTNNLKRKEFYRHIASTGIPTVDIVLALRAHILAKRSIDPKQAKAIVRACPRPPSILFRNKTDGNEGDGDNDGWEGDVVERLLWEAETLTDIARGVGYANGSKAGAKQALAPEDRLKHGWMAVRMLDGGQRLVLVEIELLKDIRKPCFSCGTECSKRCARCNLEFYCSVACQTKDWLPRHKAECNPNHKTALEELRTILAHDFHPVVITCPPPPPKPNKLQKRTKITRKQK